MNEMENKNSLTPALTSIKRETNNSKDDVLRYIKTVARFAKVIEEKEKERAIENPNTQETDKIPTGDEIREAYDAGEYR